MIQLIKSSTKFVAVIITTLLLTSCNSKIDFSNGIDGNGNVTTQTRNVENNFSKIDVSRGLNVTIEQSNSYLVEVEADENLQDHITTRVEDGTLIITTDENIDEAKARNIRVKLPLLSSVESTSGSSVSSKGILKGTDISIETTSGSETKLSLEFDNISCESSSGSSLTINGKALRLKTESTSGSTIESRDLLVNDVISESSSGSSTRVHPLVSINAKASSGSSINYYSTPKTVIKEESSGGSVSKD
ncbi:head GIN domain-containing protein [Flavobacterium sp. RSB2_4_14]|uniref:head GIN domain-containing protein n=1 Tax=Flavobacterium sp. RSB2_4_14 TaxID=3447665 RepID=UPI003F2A1D3E